MVLSVVRCACKDQQAFRWAQRSLSTSSECVRASCRAPVFGLCSRDKAGPRRSADRHLLRQMWPGCPSRASNPVSVRKDKMAARSSNLKFAAPSVAQLQARALRRVLEFLAEMLQLQVW